MENLKNMKGITIDINGNYKRLWFAVEANENSEKRFLECCKQMFTMRDNETILKDYIEKTIKLFEDNGFERIAR